MLSNKPNICGKCKHHRPNPTMFDEWYCENSESDLYECETEYEDTCECFCERRKNANSR